MKTKVDELLELLASDGRSRRIEEVSETLELPSDICRKIADFLVEYNFVQIISGKIKISPRMKDLFASSSERRHILERTVPIAAASNLRDT